MAPERGKERKMNKEKRGTRTLNPWKSPQWRGRALRQVGELQQQCLSTLLSVRLRAEAVPSNRSTGLPCLEDKVVFVFLDLHNLSVSSCNACTTAYHSQGCGGWVAATTSSTLNLKLIEIYYSSHPLKLQAFKRLQSYTIIYIRLGLSMQLLSGEETYSW